MSLILGVTTKVVWIDSISKMPIIGGFMIFVIMFVPAVLLSFLIQLTVPGLHDDLGFSKAMLILLPIWNIALWFILKVRLFLFFLPSWVLLGGISLVNGVIMIIGN